MKKTTVYLPEDLKSALGRMAAQGSGGRPFRLLPADAG
jgi:hypothetical protein